MATPLNGLKVLDFSTLLPGPYATQMMADMGADVLRVESSSRLDLVRQMEPQIDGQSAVFHYLNRGKRSLSLNLKHPAAVEIIQQLVADSDILIEQFRPGVMTRLGLGYQQLRSYNPKLIYCSITGFGQDGPLADKAGHDINYLARSGISSYLGRRDQGPLPLPTQLADISGGSQNAVIAIMAAVYERQRTGLGQSIDISMTDSCFALNALAGPGALQTSQAPEPQDHFLTGAGIYDYYQTADQRYLSVGSLEPQFRQRLCDAIGESQWVSLKDHELKARMVTLFLSQPLAHWAQLFEGVDACIEPVLNLDEAAKSELFKQRQMLTQVGGDKGHQQISSPFKFAGERPQAKSLAPACGQHSREVFNRLGYGAGDIKVLEQQGVFTAPDSFEINKRIVRGAS
ncbi:MAG: CaiB/BaiF CoA-transferase family protein [Motiliproteus sp.]